MGQAPVAPHSSKYVVAGNAAPEVAVAVWEENTVQGPKWHTFIGAEAVKNAPAKATTYTIKAVTWPTGTVRVLTFKKAHGGVLHEITCETEIYILRGSARGTVGGATVVLNTGDVATHMSGVLHSVGAGEDTTVVTWDVASLDGDVVPAVVRSDQGYEAPSYQWMQEGKLKRASTVEEAAMAPPDAIRLIVKRYDFPGNSIRVAHMMPATAQTALASAKTDSLIYMISGHLRFHQGGEIHDVRAGDFIREDASQPHSWEFLEESSFVTTSALPLGAGSMTPVEATDRQRNASGQRG